MSSSGYRRLGVLCLAGFLLAGGAPAYADGTIGRWRTQSHDGIVEIAPCGKSICGRLAISGRLISEPDLRDTRNADPSLRQRRLAGIMMLQGFSRDGDAWVGGTIYNPEDGRTYHARLTPMDADHIRVRGCMFMPICRTEVWTRIGT